MRLHINIRFLSFTDDFHPKSERCHHLGSALNLPRIAPAAVRMTRWAPSPASSPAPGASAPSCHRRFAWAQGLSGPSNCPHAQRTSACPSRIDALPIAARAHVRSHRRLESCCRRGQPMHGNSRRMPCAGHETRCITCCARPRNATVHAGASGPSCARESTAGVRNIPTRKNPRAGKKNSKVDRNQEHFREKIPR